MNPEIVSGIVKESRSYDAVLRALGIPKTGYSQRKLKAFMERHGISSEHFVGQAWRKGKGRFG